MRSRFLNRDDYVHENDDDNYNKVNTLATEKEKKKDQKKKVSFDLSKNLTHTYSQEYDTEEEHLLNNSDGGSEGLEGLALLTKQTGTSNEDI